MFQVVLYLKDEHSMQFDEVYKVHYYSEVVKDEEADEAVRIQDPELFRFGPCNLY